MACPSLGHLQYADNLAPCLIGLDGVADIQGHQACIIQWGGSHKKLTINAGGRVVLDAQVNVLIDAKACGAQKPLNGMKQMPGACEALMFALSMCTDA